MSPRTETFYRYAGEIAQDLDTAIAGSVPQAPPTCGRDEASRLETFVGAEVLTPVLRLLRSGLKSVHVAGISGDVARDAVLLSLARVLAETGRRILVVDADADGPPLAEGSSPGLTDLIGGEGTPTQVVVNSPGYEGMMAFLPIGKRPSTLESPGAVEPFVRILEGVRPSYDVTLISAPCLDRRGKVHPAATAAEGVLLVLSPGLISRDRIRRNFLQLWGVEAPIRGLFTVGVPDLMAEVLDRDDDGDEEEALPGLRLAPPLDPGTGDPALPTSEHTNGHANGHSGTDARDGTGASVADAEEDAAVSREDAPLRFEDGSRRDDDAPPDEDDAGSEADGPDHIVFYGTGGRDDDPPADYFVLDGEEDGEEGDGDAGDGGAGDAARGGADQAARADDDDRSDADDPGSGAEPLELELEPVAPPPPSAPTPPSEVVSGAPSADARGDEPDDEGADDEEELTGDPDELLALDEEDVQLRLDARTDDDADADLSDEHVLAGVEETVVVPLDDETPDPVVEEMTMAHDDLAEIERKAREARPGRSAVPRVRREVLIGLGAVAAVLLAIAGIRLFGDDAPDVAALGEDTLTREQPLGARPPERSEDPAEAPSGASGGAGDADVADAGTAGASDPPATMPGVVTPPAAPSRPDPGARTGSGSTPGSGSEAPVADAAPARAEPRDASPDVPRDTRRPGGVPEVAGVPEMSSARFRDVAPFYSIHITSFRKEGGAVSDAERLGKLSGVPADYIDYTVTGEGKNQGVWYRVIVGRFDDLDEARQTASTIKAKGITTYTRVYRISGR